MLPCTLPSWPPRSQVLRSAAAPLFLPVASRFPQDAQQTHDPVPGGEGGDEDEGEGGAGGAEPRRLPSWQAVDLEGGDAGLLPSLGRAPQQPAGLPLADISCLQVCRAGSGLPWARQARGACCMVWPVRAHNTFISTWQARTPARALVLGSTSLLAACSRLA